VGKTAAGLCPMACFVTNNIEPVCATPILRNCMWHRWEREDLHDRIWWGNSRERERLEDLGVDGRIVLNIS